MRAPQWGLFCSLIFFCLTPAYGLDLGDGSNDPDCNWDGTAQIEIKLWQCVNLEITGAIDFVNNSNDDPGVDILDIRVQQTVSISGEIDLSGDSAQNEAYGGYLGGTGVSGGNGNNGQGPAGSAGQGGTASSDDFAECSGAGGSGGRHSGLNPPNAGEDTTVTGGGCSPEPAPGGAAPTQNSSDPTNLRGEIRGGPGGGAGGGADDTQFTVAGGDGGEGGGVIRIFAGETIEILGSAVLNVNGGNGLDGQPQSAAQSGGGGGGAGGIIYLASLTDINITSGASLQASGGNPGTATSPGGSGSTGDSGIIRLEDDDGIINGADGASNPPASTAPVNQGTSSSTILTSDIAPGCAVRNTEKNFLGLPLIFILTLGFTLILGHGIVRSSKIDRASF